MEVPEKLRPVEDYLKLQGRFRHLTPADIEKIQEYVNREWEILLNKVECMQPW
jgi:pyruvate ferredoxin oxidoreductase beta subunit